jgi:hypothetical protein
MNGLREVRIARERLKGSRFIGPEKMAEVILLGVEIDELLPGHLVLQVTPDPLNGVQFRAIGRQEPHAHVRREGEPRGRMGVWAPLLSGRRRFRLSGKACAKASTKSWNISAFKEGNSRKNRSPVVGSTAAET